MDEDLSMGAPDEGGAPGFLEGELRRFPNHQKVCPRLKKKLKRWASPTWGAEEGIEIE